MTKSSAVEVFMRFRIQNDRSTINRPGTLVVGLTMLLAAVIGTSSAWADDTNPGVNAKKAASKENPPAKPATAANSDPAAAKPDSTKPAEKAASKPGDKPTKKAADKPGDKPAEKAETKSGEKEKGEKEKSAEKSSGTSTEKPSGTSTEKSGAKSDVKPESFTEKAGEKGNSLTPENKDNVLVWLYKSMGTRYVVIFLIVTFNGIALVMMITLGLRQRYLCPANLSEDFEALLDAKEYQKAYMLVRRSKSFLGKILTAGMANICDGHRAATDAMQDVGEVENLRMEQRNSHMALIAQIGPMLGLLATVDGIVCALTVIAGKNVTPKPAELAASIGIALVNTIVGLWIAIPSIIFYHIVRNRLSRMVLEAGVISSRLMRRFMTTTVSIDVNAPDPDDENDENGGDKDEGG
jgi:biopolymer transport protein ExbB